MAELGLSGSGLGWLGAGVIASDKNPQATSRPFFSFLLLFLYFPRDCDSFFSLGSFFIVFYGVGQFFVSLRLSNRLQGLPSELARAGQARAYQPANGTDATGSHGTFSLAVSEANRLAKTCRFPQKKFGGNVIGERRPTGRKNVKPENRKEANLEAPTTKNKSLTVYFGRAAFRPRRAGG